MDNQIAFGLVLATVAFAVGLFVDVLVWRIRRPAAHPLWMIGIFAAAFIIALAGAGLAGLMPLRHPIGARERRLAPCHAGRRLRHYGAIADFDPSAEIQREVAGAMPGGVAAGRDVGQRAQFVHGWEERPISNTGAKFEQRGRSIELQLYPSQ